MAKKYEHLKAKAIQLRKEKQLTLDQLVDMLKLPKTTIYYWVKDMPVPRREEVQSASAIAAGNATREKWAAIRQASYQKGYDEAEELLKNPLFRDFVNLYLTEGYRRRRNVVSVANSNPNLVKLAYYWMKQFTVRKFRFSLQYHADQDFDELREYWAGVLQIDPGDIVFQRKSNSNQLTGRVWRSVHGVLTVETSDTLFRARLQAWMDILEKQWYDLD